MKLWKKLWTYFVSFVAGMLLLLPTAQAKGGPADDSVAITTTVTASVANGKRMPAINPDDVVVTRGKERLRVTEWVPAQGRRAGLDLFILIDDASDSRLGGQLSDLKAFINRQPASTAIGVGYMRNATVQIVQPFTRDHALAADALRLPLGTAGAYSSPYLSAVDLMSRWPASGDRREILMITDGIDRAYRHWHWRRGLHTNPDADTAGAVAQKSGTIIHTLYTPGVGPWRRNYWEASSAQMDITRLSSKTGGKSFYLGLQSPVSFALYLNDLQKALDNQYLLSFAATPGKKPAMQQVSLNTEIAGVSLAAQDAVWVPGTRQ
jgi:hypothetical protein